MSGRLTYLFLWFITLAVIAGSCNKAKKNRIYIEGKIYDPNTMAYVAGADVTIAATKLSSGGIFSSGFADIASSTSNENGLFVFDFKEEKVGSYQLRVSKDQYFGIIKEVSTSEIEAGVTFSPTYNLYPIGYINLKIRNFTPYDSNDFVAYNFSSGWLNSYECCNNSVVQGHGPYYADTVSCKTYGNQNVTLTYSVTKGGHTTQYSKTLFCVAFDTTFFNIDY